MTIEVKRGGATSRYWSGEGRDAKIKSPSNLGKVSVGFVIASKGGGDTEVDVQINADSFAELAAAMIKAAPKQATEAFGAALQTIRWPKT